MLQNTLFSWFNSRSNNIHTLKLFLLVFLLSFVSSCNGHERHEHEEKKVKQKIDAAALMQKVDAETIPVAIIGGGIAGLTAAVYAANANLPCTVFEGPKPGGALAQSHSVRNWPGIIDAPGADIVGNIRKQAVETGVTIKQETVVSVDFTTRPFTIKTKNLLKTEKPKIYQALTCIVAMGSEPNYLGIPGETGPKGYWGRGVGNCAVCEGSLYKGKNVAIVGGGDASIVEAGYLSDIAKHVTVYVRKDHFRAKDIASRDRVLKKQNVKVVYETEVSEIIGNNSKVTHLKVANKRTGAQDTVATDGLFLAIGSKPNTQIFAQQLDIDSENFIILKNDQETSVPGVFAAGDICEKVWVQAIRASDQGYIAALQAKKFLDSVGYDATKIKEKAKPKQEKPKEKEKKEDGHAGHIVKELASEDDINTHVHNNTLPVVIDFFATWCMPCKQMAPIFEQLAHDFAGKVTFVKINIQNKNINVENMMRRLNGPMFSAVPTFGFVKNGKSVGTFTGTRDIESFKREIESRLKP